MTKNKKIRRNIPWKIKSFIFSLIDFFNTPSILYFLQKNFTKRSKINQIIISPTWEKHKEILKKYNTTDFIFEFGAGKNLAQNLFLSSIVRKQLVVDLNPMIDISLVEISRKLLSEKLSLKTNSQIINSKSLENFGIQYKSPYNAENTDLKDRSLDACVSTNTLEHIPRQSIIKIFRELHRTLKDTGVASLQIDYSDHYAHTDNKISFLNYLKYSDIEWKKFNHSCHYQNRLRHYDYIKIFESLGFFIVEENLDFSENNIPQEIEELFKNKDETWKATSAHIVLRKIDPFTQYKNRV